MGPKKDEIVKIERSFNSTVFGEEYTFLILEGYTQLMDNGERINFNARFFRPIDYSFGEKVCEEIVKVTEQETVKI